MAGGDAVRPIILIPGNGEVFPNYRRAIEVVGGCVLFAEDWRDASGLMLPGGGDVAPERYGRKNVASRDIAPGRDELEMSLIEAFVSAKKPVLGICRGLQVLNVYFGGTLLQNIPGHSQTEVGLDRLHKTVTADSFLKSLYGKEQIVNSAHHQAVERLGRGLRAVQWSADGMIEAVEHKTLPIWAVQWHPERLRGAMAKQGAVDGTLLVREFVWRCR